MGNAFASEMNKFLLVLAALLVAFVVSLPTETAHKKLAETPKHPDSIGEGAGTNWAVECKKEAYNTCTKCKAVAGNKCTWAWKDGTFHRAVATRRRNGQGERERKVRRRGVRISAGPPRAPTGLDPKATERRG